MLNEADHNDLMHYDHDDEELDEEDGDGPPVGRYSAMQQQYGGPTDFAFHSRSYDDEDSALQAALKASMEGLPDGFVMPELKPIEPPSIMRPAPPPPAPVAAEPEAEAESKSKHEEEDVDIVEDDDDDKPAKALSPGRLQHPVRH
jgi:ataxin-3